MTARAFLFSFVLILLGNVTAVVRADQTDDAISAAMKLSTATSYTWTRTINPGPHPLKIDGKTSVEGYSLLIFTGYSGTGAASTAKSGPSAGINTVFLGDNKYVVESNGNWVSSGSVASAPASAGAGSQNASSSSGTSSQRGRRTRSAGGSGGIGGSSQRRRSSSDTPDPPAAAGGSKLPSGVNLPHEELAIVAANYTEMHAEDAAVAGTLTGSGAETLLLPPASTQTPPEKAAGTFRLWLKDGAVTKYELKLTAETGPDGASVKGGLSETITVELTDVGTTLVDVPPAAKTKLGG